MTITTNNSPRAQINANSGRQDIGQTASIGSGPQLIPSATIHPPLSLSTDGLPSLQDFLQANEERAIADGVFEQLQRQQEGIEADLEQLRSGSLPTGAQPANRPANAAGDQNVNSQAVTGEVDPFNLYHEFIKQNPAQQMLDQLLRGEFPPDLLEGQAGQIHLMMIQDAMQARTNFMNMLSNIMKKTDEAASTAIGNMR